MPGHTSPAWTEIEGICVSAHQKPSGAFIKNSESGSLILVLIQ